MHPGPRQGGPSPTRRLAIVLGITAAYAAAEVAGGLWANSLALLADAGHMLTDFLALGLALVAAWSSRRPPDSARTYGYQRIEILAALSNGVALIVIAAFILREAWERLQDPPAVSYGVVGAVAAGGLAVNLIGARVLGRHDHGLNLRAAYLHVLGDLLGSVGTLAAAGLMAAFGWFWADPATSALIAAIIVFGGVRVVLDATHVLLEGAPAHLDTTEVHAFLAGVPGVESVHDLHVWSLGGASPLLTAHLVLDHSRPPERVLREATAALDRRFAITHATLQLEPRDFNIVGELTSASTAVRDPAETGPPRDRGDPGSVSRDTAGAPVARPTFGVRIGRLLFQYRNALFPIVLLPILFVARPRYPFGSVRADRWLDAIGLALAIAGQALRALVIGLTYIGRGGEKQRIHADGLLQAGIFAHSRNPLYVGNFLVFGGLLVVLNSWAGYLLGGPLILGAYLAIVLAEEDFLRGKFGPRYDAYRRRVPRFLPQLRDLGRTVSGMPFDWRRGLRVEYGAVFAWVSTAMALLVWERLRNEGLDPAAGWVWLGAWLAFVAAYLTVRILKKTRRLGSGRSPRRTGPGCSGQATDRTPRPAPEADRGPS